MRLTRPLLVAALTLTTIAASAQNRSETTHGVQMQNIDHSVRPGDDFFMYANGEWVKRTQIPADRVTVNGFSEVADRTTGQLDTLINGITQSKPAPGTDERRIADLYRAFMDENAVEQHGLASVKPTLDRIAAIRTRSDLARALGASLRADTDALNNTNFHTANIFGLWVAPGFHDPDHYAPYLMQGGLSMPSREYYLDASEHMSELRTKFAQHAAAMFRLAGLSDPEARAQRVLELEVAIAKTHISLADSENIHKANNLWTAADFSRNAPGLDWPEFFRAASLAGQKNFYVWQPTAITAESALVASVPIEAWKDLLTLHVLDEDAPYLPKRFADERFAFYGTALTGATAQRPRDQRAILLENQVLGEAVGKHYAAKYFSAEAKAQAEALVRNLLTAFHHRLEAITWMAPKTKREAIAKLSSLQVSVGYPDRFRSYNGLDIRPDDLAGDVERSRLFEYHYRLSRIAVATDRKEWVMTPQTVNAVNLPLDNALNFPAAILQPPFFDPQAPAAFNYGAIGSVIGHEISHTFDSEGAAFDSHGKVRDWWTPADFAHFNAATSALAKQFDSYEPLPGVHVNGRQTLGEDIADLGGINASFDAFHDSLHGQAAPVVNGLTGDQQFFLAFGQNWQTKTRAAALRQQLLTDPHAPGQIRAETVRNLDAWYKDFNVQPTDKLYLAPDQRVHIW